MRLIFYRMFFLLILMMNFIGCARPTMETSKFTISLPSQKDLNSGLHSKMTVNAVLSHVIINIRGPGIDEPISFTYDKNNNSNNSTVSELPLSYSLDVPSGSARVIQVIAVYDDQSINSGEFYYGDTTLDLSGGTATISLGMSLQGSGRINGGRIAGRYYAADGTMPTGDVEIRYQPTGGKPPMVVNRSSMINGWFSVFALDSIPFDYIFVPSQIPMFSQFSLNSVVFSDTNHQADVSKIKVTVPMSYQTFNNSGQNRPSQSVLMGFFGPGLPAENKVCITASPYSYTNLYTDSSKNTRLQWVSSSVNGSSPGYISGQMSSNVSNCTINDSSNYFLSVLPFNPQLLDTWGGPEALNGFTSVFQFQDPASLNGVSPVSLSYVTSAGQYSANFKILPGITDVVQSIGIYYLTDKTVSTFDYRNEKICSVIAAGGTPFNLLNAIPINSSLTSYSTSGGVASITANSVFIFCPMVNGAPRGSGFAVDQIQIINTVPTVSGPSANTLRVSAFDKMGINQCHKMFIELGNNSSGIFNPSVTNNAAVGLSVTSTHNLTLYNSESNCLAGTNTLAANALSIPANAKNLEVWFKTPSTLTTTAIENISVTPNSGGLAASVSGTVAITLSIPGSIAAIRANLDKVNLTREVVR